MKYYKYAILLLFSFNSIIPQVVIKEAFPNINFSQIVDIQSPNDGNNKIYVVSQPGFIYSFENNESVLEYETFLDISDQTSNGGERGLLGLAFHPNFEENGYFFVDYTKANPLRTIISRFYADPQSQSEVDISTEKMILELEQPYSNHNGGQISFGPDGFLYVSFGDGGSANDPEFRAQDRTTLLGSLIRIDVDNSIENEQYRIPIDNPYVGNNFDFREEIFAYGLRNVWRFSFDSETNNLWAADVGQGKWEEINIIEKGGNYGWNTMEGIDCFNASVECDQNGLELPIWKYGHNNDGGYSITGGFVYHGNNVSELQNKYIYGDFVSGNIWMFQKNNDIPENKLISNTDYQISTFGVDEKNELYFADYSSGKIYTFEGTPVSGLKKYDNFDFSLNQNYPNPFNPSTTIKYTIPNKKTWHGSPVQNVTLKILDILGQEIITLVNEEQVPGNYEVKFNGRNFASGIYFAKLSSGNFSKTISMQLIK